MVRTERRHVPRMTVKGPSYVNLDPNNGGVILNISEGGLCFQSPAPIQRIERIRFWFSYRSQRIEAEEGRGAEGEEQTKGVSRFIEVGSELSWIDQTRKTGGLRFTNLPAGAREQIRDWMRQTSLVNVNEKAALSRPKSRFFGVKQWLKNTARGASARLGALFRRVRSGKFWDGFSGGMLAGVLVSALLVAVFSFPDHSRELGATLIWLGERLGGRTWSEPRSPRLQVSSQEPRPASPDQVAPESSTLLPDSHLIEPESQDRSQQPKSVAEASIQAPFQEKLASRVTLPATESYEVKLQTKGLPTPSLSTPSVKPSEPPALSSTPDRQLSPSIDIASASDPNTKILRSNLPELANQPPGLHVEPSKVEGNGMRPEKYLEVGKFREKMLADTTKDKLSQKGFPTTVIQWNRFRGKSYQVLVGPYGGDREADAVLKDLVSLGFAPRSYERGRRDFRLPPALKVAGMHLPVGDCVISWESYTTDASVKIEDSKGMGVTVEGRWAKQGVRYNEDAIVYQKNSDGSRTLIEIRLAGKGQALVFGSS